MPNKLSQVGRSLLGGLAIETIQYLQGWNCPHRIMLGFLLTILVEILMS